MKTLLKLTFSDKAVPLLERFEFGNSTGGRQVSVRSHDALGRGALEEGVFPWNRGMRALSVLLLRAHVAFHEGGILPVISGYPGSLAAALDYALSKSPHWLVGLFGSDSAGCPNIDRLIRRTNPECTMPGPVSLGVNEHVLDVSAIEIFGAGGRLGPPAARSLIEELVAEDEKTQRARAQQRGAPIGAASRQGEPCPFGPAFQPYWDRLSPRERGMLLDEEALAHLCPEEAALATAAVTPGTHVIDAFCGAGGSAIGFARAGKRVTAIDICRERLEMARFNAALYGVEDRIRFVHGDARELLHSLEGETVYLAPCWGEESTLGQRRSKLVSFTPLGGEFVRTALKGGRNVVLQLPIHFDFNELKSLGRPVNVSEDRVAGELFSYSALLRAA